MQILMRWVQSALNLSPRLQTKLLASLLIILTLWLLRLLVTRFATRRTEDARVHYRWRKATAYAAVVLGVLLIGVMWLEDIRSMAVYLGLVSAGLAIALKDPLANLFGWAFILWRRPFVVGDRIQIGQFAGDVIDLRIFQFTLLEIGNWVDADQSTGRVIHIPNGKVLSEALANYTTGFEYIWNEVPVRVTFESNWEKAKEILQEIADRHAAQLSQVAADRIRQAARRFMILYSKLAPIVYTQVEENGVLLTIRYMCDPRRRRSSEHAIWEDILKAFAEQPDIEFAYPTQRFFQRWIESPQGREGRGEGSGVTIAETSSDPQGVCDMPHGL
ncbi:MAG: mechanosensitive ion channel family protein [Anaerolineales bacterium]|nr:MAG: mechanosensitive ion channel family protein [Anaerolineales bacterium]